MTMIMTMLLLMLACDGADPPPASGDDSDAAPVAGSAGCRADSPLTEGEHTLSVDDLERRYMVRLPVGYDVGGPWPVVFALHGNGTGLWYWDLEGTSQDLRTPLRDDAVLVIPEAIDGDWRDYDADPSTWPGRIAQELAFFEALHAEVTDRLCVDEQRLFSLGFSGGGSFSWVLACDQAWVRGIAVGGSVMYIEPEACERPVAAWITVGQAELNDDRERFRDTVAQQAGCAELSAAPTPTDDDPAACVDGVGCGADTPVRYCTHAGGHQWPAFGAEQARDFLLGLP